MARRRQLKLEDLAGPERDLPELERHLGMDFDEQRPAVATVLERVRLDHVDDASRRERPRAWAAGLGMLLVGAHALVVAGFGAMFEWTGLTPTQVLTHVIDDPERAEAVARLVVFQAGAYLATGTLIALLVWMREGYDQSAAFKLKQPALSMAEATWGFFIPVLNLFRPYQALEQLHAASDPEQLPNVPEVVTEEGPANYRRSAVRRRFVEADVRTIRFPILLFWGAYLGLKLLRFYGAHRSYGGYAALATAGVAFLGFGVVAAIHLRRVELRRRIRRLLEEHEQLGA